MRPRTRWGTTKLDTIRDVIAAGGTLPDAAAAVGVSSKTLQRHRATDPRVAEAVTAGLAAQPVKHGTRGEYGRGCRCSPCREANTVSCRTWRQAKAPAA